MKLYEKDPASFPLKLLSSFQGFIYLGEENKLILFSDHMVPDQFFTSMIKRKIHLFLVQVFQMY